MSAQPGDDASGTSADGVVEFTRDHWVIVASDVVRALEAHDALPPRNVYGSSNPGREGGSGPSTSGGARQAGLACEAQVSATLQHAADNGERNGLLRF
jgi:hypothetical protein